MFKPTIGLEIHSELNTKSKMFCNCKNDPDEKNPNVNICPICTAQPGTLPVINREAVKKIIKTGIALNCHINKNSKFDRKNYFYPDLPKGYQISQYDIPFCENGYLMVKGRKINITRIHLEEDTGRLMHSSSLSSEKSLEEENYSLVDFNRAGVPLMELVTEPEIISGEEAREFAQEFQLILKYLGVSYANMEKGQLRVEVNISLSNNEKLGTKVEIKNLNSFRVVEKAVEYEIKRQREILEKGEKVVQETRGWNDAKGLTISQRKKEEAHDYRYFPEPDLPHIHLSKEFIGKIKMEIPELPQERRKRMVEEYGLDEKDARTFTVNKKLGEYFEMAMSELRNWVKEIEIKKSVNKEEFFKLSKLTANYIISDLQGLIKGGIAGEVVTPENFAEFITLIYENKISSKIAKIVLEEMFKTGEDPTHIIDEKELSQINDQSEMEKIIEEVIQENPKPVEDYRKGKENAFQFLIGKTMAKTKGKASPSLVKSILSEKLIK